MSLTLLGVRKFKANYHYIRWFYWDSAQRAVVRREVRESRKSYNNTTANNRKTPDGSVIWAQNETIDSYQLPGTKTLRTVKYAYAPATLTDPATFNDFVYFEDTADYFNKPCSLVFNNPPFVVTHETVTGNDGTVTISATSADTPLTYSLNDVDYQISNEFTGLAPGDYTAYVLDSNPDQTCKISLGFTILPYYGTVYRHKFDQLVDGVTGFEVEVLIRKKGYSGLISDIAFSSGNPVTVRYIGGDSIFEPIVGSQATITLIDQDNFTFHQLFTTQNREYRLDINVNGSLVWSGYHLPEQYEEQYIDAPYQVSISASDGLGYLKNIPFTDDFNQFITGYQSQMYIISTCLRKLDLDLQLYESINVYENGMDSTNADSPLTQAFVNCDLYFDKDGQPFNCYDVLRHQLLTYGARIYQANGYFHIERPLEKSSSYVRRLFNLYGVYQSNETYNPAYSGTEVCLNKNLAIDANIKKQVVSYIPVTIKNLILDGDFEEQAWSGKNTLRNWTKVGSNAVEQFTTETGLAVSIVGDANDLSQGTYIKSTPEYNITGGEDVRITFRFQYYVDVNKDDELGSYAVMGYALRVGDYYYKDNGTESNSYWTDQFEINELIAGSINNWGYYKRVTSALVFGDPAVNVSGDVEVFLYQAVDTNILNADIIKTTFDNVSASLTVPKDLNRGVRVPGNIENVPRSQVVHEDVEAPPIVQRDYVGEYEIDKGIEGEQVTLLHGDGPDASSLSAIIVDNNRSDLWFRRGVTETVSIGKLLLNDYMSQYYLPQKSFNGRVYGSFNFTNTFEDATYFSGIKFIFKNATWDVKTNIWNIEVDQVNNTDRDYLYYLVDQIATDDNERLNQGGVIRPENRVVIGGLDPNAFQITDEGGGESQLTGTAGLYVGWDVNGVPTALTPPTGLNSVVDKGTPSYSIIESVSGATVTLKGLLSGSNITISEGVNGLTISAPDPGGGGEVNTIGSVGAGTSLVAGKSGVELQIKSIKSSDSSVTISSTATEIDITTSLSSVNYWLKSGTALSYTAGAVTVNTLISQAGVTINTLTGTGTALATLSSTGALGRSLVTNALISGTANIEVSKLAPGSSGQIVRTVGGTVIHQTINKNDFSHWQLGGSKLNREGGSVWHSATGRAGFHSYNNNNVAAWFIGQRSGADDTFSIDKEVAGTYTQYFNVGLNGAVKINTLNAGFVKSSSDGTLSVQASLTTSDITNLSSYTGLDGRYYTEGEVNTLLAGKSDTGHTHTFASITSKPTTLGGYGITDAVDGSGTANYVPIWNDANTLGNSVMQQSLNTISIPSGGRYRIGDWGIFAASDNSQFQIQKLTGASWPYKILIPTSGSIVLSSGLSVQGGTLQLSSGVSITGDILMDHPTGTKIGLSTSEKFAFHGATPIARETVSNLGVTAPLDQSTLANLASSAYNSINNVRVKLDDLIDKLQNKGLIG